MRSPAATRAALLGGVLAVMGAACSRGADRSEPASDGKRRVVTLVDRATATRVAADELLTVELEARPSAGYTWVVTSVDEGVLTLAGREHVSALGLGRRDTERLLFKGVAAGTTTLSLAYRRPWDPQPGEATYALDVEVLGPYTGSYVPPALPVRAAYVADGSLPARYSFCDPGDGTFSACTPIKDQGDCGGCWAFATTGVFENILHRANPSARVDLSEQYLISCNNEDYSCDGGGQVAFDYFISARRSPPESAAGAVYTKDFPYKARDVSCGSTAHPHHEKLTRYRAVGRSPTRIDAMKKAIMTTGPIWVAVCADDAFSDWAPRDSRSVFRGRCTELNHAVVLVGWDDSGDGSNGYWLLRNSWGTWWGDKGYMRLGYGAAGVEEEVYAVTYAGSSSGSSGGASGSSSGSGTSSGGASSSGSGASSSSSSGGRSSSSSGGSGSSGSGSSSSSGSGSTSSGSGSSSSSGSGSSSSSGSGSSSSSGGGSSSSSSGGASSGSSGGSTSLAPPASAGGVRMISGQGCASTGGAPLDVAVLGVLGLALARRRRSSVA